MCTSEFFQENVSTLLQGLEFARTYLDDLLCLSKDHFNEHLEDVEKSLRRFKNQTTYKRYRVKFGKDQK